MLPNMANTDAYGLPLNHLQPSAHCSAQHQNSRFGLVFAESSSASLHQAKARSRNLSRESREDHKPLWHAFRRLRTSETRRQAARMSRPAAVRWANGLDACLGAGWWSVLVRQSTDRISARRSMMLAWSGKRLRTRIPGILAAFVANGPRTSVGAPGFGSHVSS